MYNYDYKAIARELEISRKERENEAFVFACEHRILPSEVIWLARAIRAAEKHDCIRMWSALEHFMGIAHDGRILEILKPFEIPE